jgi:hypothetical protein
MITVVTVIYESQRVWLFNNQTSQKFKTIRHIQKNILHGISILSILQQRTNVCFITNMYVRILETWNP